MNFPLAKFAPAPAVFSGGKHREFVELNWVELPRIQTSAAIMNSLPNSRIQVSAEKSGTLFQSVPQQASFEEKLFDSLVSLKVSVSQYAMHLPLGERHRIFDRLDSVLNIDDWHEEDRLPLLRSFQNFLKWTIYSRRFDWSSIGVSNEGNILIAWSRSKLALTANFSSEGIVTWTAAVDTETGPAHAVGSCSLQYFAKLSVFYLESRGEV